MPPTRRPGIVRRAVMALAVLVLLLSGYLSSYVALPWLVWRGYMNGTVATNAERSVYAPVNLWCEHYLPGTDALMAMRHSEMATIEIVRRLSVYSLGCLAIAAITWGAISISKRRTRPEESSQ